MQPAKNWARAGQQRAENDLQNEQRVEEENQNRERGIEICSKNCRMHA
jgi:hypothetical protein